MARIGKSGEIIRESDSSQLEESQEKRKRIIMKLLKIAICGIFASAILCFIINKSSNVKVETTYSEEKVIINKFPLDGTTWIFVDRSDKEKRHKVLYTRDEVFYTIYDKDGSIYQPQEKGKYTLQDSILIEDYGDYIAYLIYSETRIIDSKNPTMIFTPQR